jgi:dihydroneopterin aldolase
MDKIFIRDLEIYTIIGVLPHERIEKQPLVINLEIATNITIAATTEKLSDTIDYIAVVQRISEFMSNSQFQLLETLAEKTAQLILNEFKIVWLRLEIIKPRVLAPAKIGLIIERGKK